MESFGLRLFVVILFMTLLSNVLGHSYLTKPISRSNQASSQTGCRGPACLGPCDASASKARTPITIARGANIIANWPRNNHAGGFIRFAWAPTSSSDSHTAFDGHVQQINCHEVGACHPDSASAPNGGDSGPSDGSSRACSSSLTVPMDLTDGKWTLQWAWFGGAFSLGDYYSCVDYQISGGPSGAAVSPVFVGGDYTYPGQNKCKFFNTDKLHRCVNEPCANPGPLYPASQEQSGPASGFSGNTPSTTGKTVVNNSTGSNPSLTTGKPVTTPSTTGKPVTTPSTTGKPVTTPSTTGKPVTNPSTTGLSNTCTGSQQRCVDSNSYQVCTYAGTFAAPQSCQEGLICQTSPSTGNIYCTRPGETIREGINNGNKLTSSLWFAFTFLVVYLTW